jgi:hypothetical protein
MQNTRCSPSVRLLWSLPAHSWFIAPCDVFLLIGPFDTFIHSVRHFLDHRNIWRIFPWVITHSEAHPMKAAVELVRKRQGKANHRGSVHVLFAPCKPLFCASGQLKRCSENLYFLSEWAAVYGLAGTGVSYYLVDLFAMELSWHLAVWLFHYKPKDWRVVCELNRKVHSIWGQLISRHSGSLANTKLNLS